MENDKHIKNLEETSQEIKTNTTKSTTGESADLTQYCCANVGCYQSKV